MRQRKIRNLDEKLEVFSGLQVSDTAGMRGAWEKPCYIEIGCGKGQFVASLARKHPLNYFMFDFNFREYFVMKLGK